MKLRTLVRIYPMDTHKKIGEAMVRANLALAVRYEQYAIVGDFIPNPDPAQYLMVVKNLQEVYHCTASVEVA